MRIATAAAIALTLVAAAAAAQQGARARRAPLADVDDLEPAVDVSAPRVALATPRQYPPRRSR